MSEPDLSDLDAFLAVARCARFRQAALLRGVSASSLSEAMRRLETRLGVRLLNRTTRSVTPTEAGERLIERLAPAFGEIAGALDAVNGFRDSPTGTLRLNVPSIVVARNPAADRRALSDGASGHHAGNQRNRHVHRRARRRFRCGHSL